MSSPFAVNEKAYISPATSQAARGRLTLTRICQFLLQSRLPPQKPVRRTGWEILLNESRFRVVAGLKFQFDLLRCSQVFRRFNSFAIVTPRRKCVYPAQMVGAQDIITAVLTPQLFVASIPIFQLIYSCHLRFVLRQAPDLLRRRRRSYRSPTLRSL
jgi:hypothetical protein